jgi:hypothetical protein
MKRVVDYVVVISFAVIAIWAVLRLIGGERERRVRDLAYTIATAPPPADSAAQIPVATPVRSKPAR